GGGDRRDRALLARQAGGEAAGRRDARRSADTRRTAERADQGTAGILRGQSPGAGPARHERARGGAREDPEGGPRAEAKPRVGILDQRSARELEGRDPLARPAARLSQAVASLTRAKVEVTDNQIEAALKTLKKVMIKGGLYQEMKRRVYYEKPSVKR